MVSLVLLLLGFFVVLTATAERHDERAAAVLASLSATFGDVIDTGDAMPSNLGDVLAMQAVETDIRRAFETLIDGAVVDVDPQGRLARVRVPGGALFVGDSAVTRPGADELIRAIADSVASAAGLAVVVTVQA
ncbi:MAG: hypothetical protein ACREER_05375, partial [Alphaproteobacteria bacterium]